jgi:MFS family permease
MQTFTRFWTASTVSDFGTQVTAVAMQVLVLETLGGSATDVGLLNAARWVPYLLFGLVVGVLVDRCRRLPLLIGTDIGRAVVLGVVALGALSLPTLTALMFVFGTLSLVNDVAAQSFLPRLVFPDALTSANARLGQSDAIARSTGPLAGGSLVGTLTAPFAILIDALSYLCSAAILATLKITEPARREERRAVFAELREGLAWVYRHRMLAPMALGSHAWMIFSSMFSAVYVAFALRDLGVGAFGVGVIYAAAGVGGVIGGALANRSAERFGVGRTVVFAKFFTPIGFAMVALAPVGPWALALAAAGQFVVWVGICLESPNEMGYRQSVTPDRLQSRMNATIRSLNWGMVVIGGPLGGLLADTIGYRPALWITVGGMAAVALVFSRTAFRYA